MTAHHILVFHVIRYVFESANLCWPDFTTKTAPISGRGDRRLHSGAKASTRVPCENAEMQSAYLQLTVSVPVFMLCLGVQVNTG